MEETRASPVVAKNEGRRRPRRSGGAARALAQPVLNLGVAETRHDTSTSPVGGPEVELPLFDRG
jgi:hypothetical protein